VEPETGSSGKVTAILVTIVILLLMALFALAGVLYVRIKKLNSDDNPYGAFDDQHAKSSDGL
jgi:flagellar basal body-associated protein FliL